MAQAWMRPVQVCTCVLSGCLCAQGGDQISPTCVLVYMSLFLSWCDLFMCPQMPQYKHMSVYKWQREHAHVFGSE